MIIQQKELGLTGFKIPEIGLGTWEYHTDPAPLRAGLEAGAWFIDTAESYGSEPVVAEAIRGVRERVFLATKVSMQHLRRTDVFKAAEQSLRQLGVTHIDLYQIHHPNPQIPIEETMDAMETLVDQGKVRFIGVSNFNREQLQNAQRMMRKHPIVSNQVRYNLADRTIEAELLPYCQANGITVIAYSPLCRSPVRILDCDPRGVLHELARETGKTVVQVALNWCLCRERVVVIPRGGTLAHVTENCGASGWRLTSEQVQRLNREIIFRERGPMEVFLRACMPASLVKPLKKLIASLPRGWRRRFN